MKFYDALETAGKRAGVTMDAVCARLGKGKTYISGNRSRGSSPSVDNAAAMLGACGYALVALPADSVPADALAIDAPPVSDDERAAALERRRAALLRELDRLDAGGLLG